MTIAGTDPNEEPVDKLKEQPVEVTADEPGMDLEEQSGQTPEGTSRRGNRKKNGKTGNGKSGRIWNFVLLFIVLILAGVVFYGIKYIYLPNKPAENTPVFGPSSTFAPTGSPTCPVNLQLATPVGVNRKTRLIVVLYDPKSAVNPGLDLANGQRLTSIQEFVTKMISDVVGPGDEISVFQLGFDNYPAARVTRQYSYLTIYPQLYVAPSYSTLTSLPPTGVPTPGYGEVATQNAFRVVSTQRAEAEAAALANYNCQVQYYNDNVISTATAWQQMQSGDINAISTAVAVDIATVTPGKSVSSELAFGGLYYGLYFATVDLQADCAKYDECDLILVDDLHYYRKNNPDNLPISLTGVNIFTIMPNCRDINQPDCADLQSYWTPQFQKFGVNKILYWNGVRAEINLLGEIGR